MEKILNQTCDRLANIIIHPEKDVTSDNAENKKSLLNEVETPKKEVKDSLSDEEQKKFNRLITKAKQLASEGEVRMALELSQRALKIWHSEKLIKRIEKMKTYLKEHENEESEESEEDNGMMHVGKGFYLYKDLYNNLYSHQKEGVLWMWGLFRKKKGGILGDDMGLGKTIQVISFLSGLFDMEKVNSVLIVMPVSLISNWEKEFQKWAPGIRVSCFHGSSKREKERALAKVQRRGGVCLTTYGLVVTSWEQLGQQDGRDFVWDYMILDEGHKIKNPTKTTKGVHAIGARNRMILTGTPIQNNLRELWALFDFVHDGGLLGTARTFKMEFDNPITRARERDATVGERKLGMEMAETLKKIIAPYFLRRTKAEVEKKKKAMANNDDGKNEISMPSLTRKNDFIVWLFLTPTQQKIYHDFISLESVKELLMTKKSPLVALTVLKKLCDHPRLLSRRACAQLGLDGEENMDDSALDSEDGLTCAANQIDHIDGETLINESGKLIVILDLLDNLKMEGHRTLLFSQSRKMLNIIEKLITDRGHKIMRLDGTVTQVSERDQRIKKFQTDDSYSVFLLTTQVGGVGLTLTAADRVIIYDPSWNPATDEQAVDRVFRIGQNKNVVIYRLITCGTVEEKIYRRQVFKNSITQQTTGTDKNPYRYFTKQELKELFSLDNPRESKTQQQLEEMHSESRKSDPSLDSHIAYLYSLDIFGLSDHDLMFNQEAGKMDDMDADGQDVMDAHHTQGNDYIQHRVQKAQELIRMESELGVGFDDRFGAKQRSGSGGQGYSQNINFGHSNLDLNSLPGSQADQATKPDISEKFVDLTMAEDTDEEDEKERNFYDHVADTNDQMPEVKREPGTVGIKEEITSPTSSEPTSFVTIKQEVTSPISHVGVKTEPMSPERFGVHNIEDSSDDDCVIMSPTKDSNMTENISKNSGALSEEQKENDNDADSSFKIKGDEETEHTGDLLSSFIAADDEDSIVIDDFKQQEQNGDGNNFPSPGSNSSPSKKIIDYEEDEKENIPLDKSPALPSLSKTKTPSKNNKRKSVARSPWHHKTPQGVTSPQTIREELFISPDVSHPIMNYSPSRKPGRLGSNLNTTIFSAFVSPDSPAVREAKRSKRSLDDSIPSIKMQSPNKKDNYGNALHQTLVTASPGSPFSPSDTDDFNESNKKAKSKSKLYQTFVCDSGSENELDMSDNAVVADSVPCTPVENHIGANQYIGETDEEDTPKIIRKDGNCDFDDEMVDSPIQTTKSSRHKKAVIASSDEESDSEEGLCNVEYSENHGKEKTIKHVNDSEDDDALESPAQTVSSDDEDCLDTNKNSRQKPRQMNRNSFLSGQAHAEGGSSDEETDEEETDLSGFIVNSDDEEMDSEEDVEEADISLSDVGNSHEFKSLSSVQQQNFEEYIKKSRSLLKKEKYEEALHAALQAVEICPEPVVQAFALKIHQHMDK